MLCACFHANSDSLPRLSVIAMSCHVYVAGQTAEDSPNTRTNLAASSFFLMPLNYFDYDASIDSINSILLTVMLLARGLVFGHAGHVNLLHQARCKSFIDMTNVLPLIGLHDISHSTGVWSVCTPLVISTFYIYAHQLVADSDV